MLNNSDTIRTMYCGEEKRDASSKVRGFLFQDLIAIDELLKAHTDYICLEYIEDVFQISGDVTSIIQAKYYPRSTVQIKEIVEELYYQFLRMEIFGYVGEIVPILAVHSKNVVSKPDIKELLTIFNINNKKCMYNFTHISKWMQDNIYSLDKASRIKKTFETFGNKESVERFYKALKIKTDYKALSDYRVEIVQNLNKLIGKDFFITDGEIRQNILIGLAVQFVQKSYDEKIDKKEVFDKRKLEAKKFVSYIKNLRFEENEENIIAYLGSLVMDSWDAIEESNPTLSAEKFNLLECLRDNTLKWFFKLGGDSDGQFQLLNTVSLREEAVLLGFKSKGVVERCFFIHEHRDAIIRFLHYLWKIILNINGDLLGKDITDKEMKRLEPDNYFDQEEKQYLKAHFQSNKSESSIILDELNTGRRKILIGNLFKRLKVLKPNKWLMANANKNRGRYTYSLTVSDIKEGKSISSISSILPEMFQIECMNCIKIDENDWDDLEDCQKTIFSIKCVEESEEEK